MKRLALMAALMLLAGCNVVVTKTPLFTRADEAGAVPLRAGLWRFTTEDDCKVDESRPLIDWPECAGGVVVKDGNAGYYDRKSEKPVWKIEPLVLTAGTPRIAQLMLTIAGDIKFESAPPYGYAGVKPTRFDSQERITAFTFWPVQCGAPSSQEDHITQHPLPGMDFKPDDPVCTTTSPEALRNAAKASEAWAPKVLTAHWLRDGPG